MFNEMNKTYANTVRDGIMTDNMEFKKLADFIGKSIDVDGFFFTEGRYGKQVVVVGNGYLIDMPKRCVEVFTDIKNDAAKLEAVLSGKLMLTDIQKLDSKNGKTVVFKLADK